MLAVFLTGVTEPLEFMFMFCAIPLYIVYAILQGCAFALSGVINLRLHSFGNLEFLTRVPMSVKAGLVGDIIHFLIAVVVFFVIGYFVAYFMIGKFKFATPGRLGNYNTEDEKQDTAGERKESSDGQPERVKNPELVADKDAWKAEGALGLVKKEKGIQAIYGPKADVLKSDINDIL